MFFFFSRFSDPFRILQLDVNVDFYSSFWLYILFCFFLLVFETMLSLSELPKLEAKAASGDLNTNCRLGKLYLDGILVKRSPEEAFKRFTIGAEANHSDSQGWLAWCFRKGLGVEP